MAGRLSVPGRTAPLVAVTDHALERYRQRVRGALDPRPEIAGRVSQAWAAERVSDEPPEGLSLIHISEPTRPY